jgi:voltage-gated potassium channel
MQFFSRASWYTYLNEPSRKHPFSLVLYAFLGSVIVLNVAQIVIESLDSQQGVVVRYDRFFQIGFALVFLSEYFARIWVAAEKPSEKNSSLLHRRWSYVSSPIGMIDFLSFMPTLIILLMPESVFGDLRFLKLLSIIRVLKLTRYSASLSILATLYRENGATLIAAAMIMLMLSFLGAIGIYIFENPAQPEVFSNIPDAMWWALVTITTVGYGDITPITIGGKLFGAVVMITGVGTAAIPAGVFASSFVQLVREQEQERRVKRRRFMQGGSAVPENKLKLKTYGLSRSEQREVEFMITEYELTVDQSVNVIKHFRH